ncbi:MAG: HlyC/CorC family transporter [Oscillospiraceae bacterium]|nr:HlyC/CorC family transporter [Oscillospiraceae bacterium]
MDSHLSTIAILICLLAMSAFFSASETALTGANRIRLKNQAENGDKKASLALKLIGNYDGALSTLLIANNIVNILSSSLTTVLFIDLFGANAVGIATAVTTVMVIIFGEVLPKSFANENSETMIKFSSPVLSFLMKAFLPFVAILNLIKSLLKKSKGENEDFTPSYSEEELISIIDEIEDEGVLEETQAELVQSAIEFNDIFAEEILTPRVDISAVSVDDSMEKVQDMFLRHNFSRMPVYEDSIDHICGFISQKDLFSNILKGEIFQWQSLVKPCLYVPPKKKIIDIMNILQKQKMHMAIVTDEYGGTLGILTLEDILEELVGDIWDEHDEITQFLKKNDDATYEALGEIEVSELYEAILESKNSPVKDFTSLSAYLLELFGRIPQNGDFVCDESFQYTILEMSEHRIIKVNVAPIIEKDFEN